MKRNIYGVPALTLTESVEQLMMQQGNDRRSHYISYLTHARWAWKSLLLKTIWAIRQEVVDVNTLDSTITIPDDMVRMVSLSVVDDCGNLQVINQNPNFNTLPLTAHQSTCSCKACCGEETLCAVLDSIQVRTEDVTINGQVYQKRIWNRKNPDGSFLEVTETPFLNTTTDAVESKTATTMLCKLVVDDSGCITPCEENKALLTEFCSCYLTGCHDLLSNSNADVTPYRSAFGHWKWDTVAGDVVHLKGVRAKQIIITYQSSGDCSKGEMLVPEYALDALWFAIMHRMAAFNPNANRGDKMEAKDSAEREKTRLEKFLNPIHPSTFLRLQGTIPKW